ncbi:alpha-amylase family glycosyl hydrolase, partial [Nonomuraea dietziae]|uniref:alpha-amylase family glycosyl hydrolase n=1 Tax=Nonomuraea dietziae TaxID=65515 RepID=UPI0031E0435E
MEAASRGRRRGRARRARRLPRLRRPGLHGGGSAPRTRADLVALVRQAHRRGIRVILDVLLNHSGENWDYDLDGQDVVRPPYRAGPPYDFGVWRDGK